MNFKRILLLTFILLLLPFTIRVFAGDFGQSNSLFTDIKANQVGDILTVNIYEDAKATHSAESKSEKSADFSTSGGPGTGFLDFIPLWSAGGKNSNSFDGKGENLRNQSLRAKMSVTVIAVKENGDLIIKGSRTIGISKDKETMTLTGVVRQKDISPGNTIDSYLIADAEISYNGTGMASAAARPGVVMRFLNWLF